MALLQHGRLTIGQDGTVSTYSLRSVGSVGSIDAVASAGSIRSVGSVGSILSIGSSGSILSVGSAGSILSIGSVGSILSIGSSGSILCHRTDRSFLHASGKRMSTAQVVCHVAKLTVVAVVTGGAVSMALRVLRSVSGLGVRSRCVR